MRYAHHLFHPLPSLSSSQHPQRLPSLGYPSIYLLLVKLVKTLLVDAFKLSSMAVPYLLSFGWGQNTSHRKWYKFSFGNGLTAGVELVDIRNDVGGQKPFQVPPKSNHLPHKRRGDKRRLRTAEQVKGLYAGVQLLIEQVNVALVLIIRCRPQPPQDKLGAHFSGEEHRQRGVAGDSYPRLTLKGDFYPALPHLWAKHRLLGGIYANANHDLIKKREATLDDFYVAEGDGVKTPWE